MFGIITHAKKNLFSSFERFVTSSHLHESRATNRDMGSIHTCKSDFVLKIFEALTFVSMLYTIDDDVK